MATVQYIEHNGERIELANKELHTEVRCDSCGEYIAPGQFASQAITVTLSGKAERTARVDAHTGHINAALERTAASLIAQIQP